MMDDRKWTRKNRRGKTKKKKGLFRFAKKLALAPSRNAFLSLVYINAFKLAERLYKAMKRNEPALKNKWESFGGNYAKLKNTVMKRINKRIKKGKRVGEIAGMDAEYIGNPAIAAWLAAALPIIKALGQFIGKNKGAGGGDGAAGDGQQAEEMQQ